MVSYVLTLFFIAIRVQSGGGAWGVRQPARAPMCAAYDATPPPSSNGPQRAKVPTTTMASAKSKRKNTNTNDKTWRSEHAAAGVDLDPFAAHRDSGRSNNNDDDDAAGGGGGGGGHVWRGSLVVRTDAHGAAAFRLPLGATRGHARPFWLHGHSDDNRAGSGTGTTSGSGSGSGSYHGAGSGIGGSGSGEGELRVRAVWRSPVTRALVRRSMRLHVPAHAHNELDIHILRTGGGGGSGGGGGGGGGFLDEQPGMPLPGVDFHVNALVADHTGAPPKAEVAVRVALIPLDDEAVALACQLRVEMRVVV